MGQTFLYLRNVQWATVAIPWMVMGCASPSITIRTDPPGAEVSGKKGDAPAAKIGVSPVTITRESAGEWLGEDVEIIVAKEGYATQGVLIPKSIFGSTATLNFELKELKLPTACAEMGQEINEISRGIAEAQNLIFKKNFEKAKDLLSGMATRYPSVPTVFALLGNVGYLTHNYSDSFQNYKRSLALDPNSPEINRMIQKLQGQLGEKTSNSPEGKH